MMQPDATTVCSDGREPPRKASSALARSIHCASAAHRASADEGQLTVADAGIRDMPLHSLRHTAAAAWLAVGHPLIFVQRQLGHRSITTTEEHYGHPAARREAGVP
jgi:integrase